MACAEYLYQISFSFIFKLCQQSLQSINVIHLTSQAILLEKLVNVSIPARELLFAPLFQ